MALLLDTHVWVWSQAEPERLGPTTAARLEDPQEALFVSPVSTLELARLTALGRLDLRPDVERWVEASLDLLACATAEVTHAVARGAYALPGDFHRDPADRLLVATARVHGLTLVTADARILDYPHVQTLDART